LLLLLCGAYRLRAQHHAFQFYSEENGLRNLGAQYLLQDRTGFIWVGTQNGLYRYEGQHFVAFGREQGLSDSMISVLHETPDGVLWAGTRSGLFRFDGSRFIPAARAMPWEIRWQFGLASDHQNRLFAATNRGLLIGDPPSTPGAARNFRFYTNAQLPPGEPVFSVHVDAEDVVWFSYGTQLCQLRAEKLTIFGTSAGLPRQSWKAILSDRDGNVWLRSPRHLLVWDRKAKQFLPKEDGMPPGESRSYLALDDQGRVLAPTDHGLGHWNGTRWEFLTQANGLPGDSVCCVLNDREGSVWIGMRGTGLARSRSLTNWESWERTDGLRSDEIWAIQRDLRGKLWVGTSAGLEPCQRTGHVQTASLQPPPLNTRLQAPSPRVRKGSSGREVLRDGCCV
jgi:ligand-binding sensor domain-containing protein